MLNLSLGLGLGSYATLNKGGNAASRLLNLIKNDVATALFAPYSQTDRLSNLYDGAGALLGDGSSIAREFDTGRWAGKGYESVIAAQPELLAGAWSMSTDGGTATAVEGPAGTLTLKGDGTNRSYADKSVNTITGRLYVLAFNVADTFTPLVRVGTALKASDILNVGSTQGANLLFFRATGTATWIDFNRLSATAQSVVSAVSVKEVPSRWARQGTLAARPKWYSGAKPYALFDGNDDALDTETLRPGQAGTMAVAVRADSAKAANQFILSGGSTTGDKRARLAITSSGYPAFAFNAEFDVVNVNHFNQDIVLIQTWGGGRRRCYLSGVGKVIDEARAANMDGTGDTYKLGSLEFLGERLMGRMYGSLIRSVETSDADVQNTVLPYLKGLMP